MTLRTSRLTEVEAAGEALAARAARVLTNLLLLSMIGGDAECDHDSSDFAGTRLVRRICQMTARPTNFGVRSVVLYTSAGCLILLALHGRSSSGAQESSGAVDNFFAGEPDRPKAKAPIAFSHSWEESRALAKSSGCRLLAYFTSDSCGWCRALEKRTFTDAEVVELSKQFVCVEVDVRDEKNLRVADEFRIDSIPRNYIFTSDGKVIDRRAGYVPAVEYAAWLKGVGMTAPELAPRIEKPVAPAPVGAPAAVANLAVWFVDGTREILAAGPESDSDEPRNTLLPPQLKARPASRQEPAAWQHRSRGFSRALGCSGRGITRIPDLISPRKLGWYLIRQLEDQGRLTGVRSQRLSWMPEVASCSDFKGRWLYLVNDSEHQAPAQKALVELLRPAPEMSLPRAELAEAAGKAEAALVARLGVVAYISGDPEGLKRVAATSSPQLSRCTLPPRFRLDWKVETGAIDLRGNGTIAFAKVEMRFRGKGHFGADPVLVVLQRETSHWKAFCVSSDLVSIRALPALCALQFRSPADRQFAPPVPRLMRPADGGKLGEGGQSFGWEIPSADHPLAAQVCEVLLDEKDSSWPLSRITGVQRREPPGRSLLEADTAQDITGMDSHEMRWCVWAVGVDGWVSPSEVRSYRRIGFKY